MSFTSQPGQATTMVVLDFSGTLSLQAALFGRPDSLMRELQAAGLWRMGVSSVQMFWDELVAPTWEEGSTTSKGYRRVLYERLEQMLSGQSDGPEAQEPWAAVSSFVDRYFEHSVIDPAWRELIDLCLFWPATQLVVATDHYAEATACIRRQLELLGIGSVPAQCRARPGQVIVANSADVGYPKAKSQLLEELARAQGMTALSTIAVVDDFGLNEQPLDPYANPVKAAERLSATITLLSSVFAARVTAFPFYLARRGEGGGAEGMDEAEREYHELIKAAKSFVSSQLGAA